MEIKTDKNGEQWLFADCLLDVVMHKDSINPIYGSKGFKFRILLSDIRDFEYDPSKLQDIMIITPYTRKIIKGNGEELDKLLFTIKQ